MEISGVLGDFGIKQSIPVQCELYRDLLLRLCDSDEGDVSEEICCFQNESIWQCCVCAEFISCPTMPIECLADFVCSTQVVDDAPKFFRSFIISKIASWHVVA